MDVYAATKDLGSLYGEGLGPFGHAFTSGSAFKAIIDAVSSVIGFMTVVASIWFLLQLLIGGINWISSGGDKGKLQSARDRITNAMIGLIIVVAAWAILAVAGQFFGWADILDPAKILNLIKF
ncbi:hypothetical protein A2Z33_07625 [Candidatus Gottesmanbacteria bacterium RBG_16_52_11]|uniref:Uncharacterized protein n=1 Tax=Candidatus Gottesmanbacteria bacterium RBG_16_52_11 TaxID=1798374 RepID=A0A1F5YN47_9BACT|nr:MAG: hypothetical protein A2Z33_07625 [Candidatus Gottesmanbacteria bacterium RBG_16_52_11]